MSAPSPTGLLTALTMLTLVAACSDEATPDARAGTAGAGSVSAGSVPADLPLGTGFDFYVLALSWSPAYCAIEGANANPQQCAEDRDLGFVVHGLWPQFDSGYPEFCPTREPDRVPADLGRDYMDIVPTLGLMGHQWRKHGSCSGLSQEEYFRVLRAARGKITVPPEFAADKLPARIDAMEAEDAFIAANPGMARDGIAVACQRGMLREVRICLTPSLGLRACRDVDKAGCSTANLEVPEPD